MRSLRSYLLFALSLIPQLAIAGEEKFICSLKHSKRVIEISTNHSTNDKNRHCTVSCMLALQCNDTEVLLVGILKEFRDVFGPGEADAEDIKANRYGINLVRQDRARIDQECLDQCDLRY